MTSARQGLLLFFPENPERIMTNSMNFDLEIIEVPVMLGGKSFVLKEATGAAACKYRNAMLGHTVLGESGKPVSIKGMADIEPLLVSLCLFEIITNEDSDQIVEKQLTVKDVGKWPAKVVTSLFEKAKEISNLSDEEDTEESLVKEQEELDKRVKELKESKAKNSPNNTTDGSD